MPVYSIPTDGTASEMFWDAVGPETGGGSSSVMCQCGIEHIAGNSPYCQDEDGEIIPDYKEQYESDDTKIYTGDDSVYFVHIDGKDFVYACPGCKKAISRYENWIWHNRQIIRNYFKVRIEQEKKWAEQEYTLNLLGRIYDQDTFGI